MYCPGIFFVTLQVLCVHIVGSVFVLLWDSSVCKSVCVCVYLDVLPVVLFCFSTHFSFWLFYPTILLLGFLNLILKSLFFNAHLFYKGEQTWYGFGWEGGREDLRGVGRGKVINRIY